MNGAAAITGLGAVSGFGLGVDALWNGLLSGATALLPRADGEKLGISGLPLSLVPLPDEAGGAPGIPGASVLRSPRPRATQMSLLAAEEALRDAGLLGERSTGPGLPTGRLGVCVGTTHGEKAPWLAAQRGDGGGDTIQGTDHGPALPAQRIAQAFSADRIRVACAACASGNVALGTGLGWIRAGLCDVVLCGGCDALHDFVLSGFQSLRALSPTACRPFDAGRSGLSLGEGAAFVVLESIEHARARGGRVRALLSGSGQSSDANHMTGPDREGRGAARAMRVALQDAGLADSAIDFVSAHGTATAFNDQMEGHALAAVFGARTAHLPVHSIKGAVGHSMGAAAALEAVMIVRALEDQRVPATIGLLQPDPAIPLCLVQGQAQALPMRHILSTASGFGGLNAAIIVSLPSAVRQARPCDAPSGGQP